MLFHDLYPAKYYGGVGAMSRLPRPAFFNQVTVFMGYVVGTRRGGFFRQFDANLSRILLLFPWYIPGDDLTTKVSIELHKDKNSYEERDTTKRIDITLKIRLLWVTVDSKHFRRTPSRCESASRSRYGPL